MQEKCEVGQERKGEVWTELKHLEEAVTTLSAELEILEKMIGPVLSPEKVSEGKPSQDAPESVLCPLAGKIRMIRRRVGGCTSTINKIKTGLEV